MSGRKWGLIEYLTVFGVIVIFAVVAFFGGIVWLIASVAGFVVVVSMIDKLQNPDKPGVDLSRWICPFCGAIFRKDPVQVELAKRRHQQDDAALMIAAAGRAPSCPRCAKPIDGQKFLDGTYDLPMERFRELKKQGALP